MVLVAEHFSDDALEAISLDGVFYVLPGDDNAQSMMIESVAGRQEEEILVGGTNLDRVENAAVGGSIKQTILPREGVVVHCCQCRASGGEALAALGTTAVNQLAAALGGHARAKTVRALALQYAGLERSFHDEIPG